MRVKYWINFRVNGKQTRQSVDSFEGLNGYSIDDARKADAKRSVQKAENRLLDIRSDARITFNKLADWYLGQPTVRQLKSYATIRTYLTTFNKTFGESRISDIKVTDLDNFQIILAENGFKPKTIDNLLNYVKTMLIKAENDELIDVTSLRPFRKNKNLLAGKKRGSNAAEEF